MLLNDYGKHCNVIFRNPEGTRENNDEYIILILRDGVQWFFSAYEERPPALKDKLFNGK